jgi:uncharacterized membrane protein YraQ (UPF0718 family)
LFSFLISSPLVDLASVLLLASIFHWKIAIAYVLAGLILAVVSGTIISNMKLEGYVQAFVYGDGSMEYVAETMGTRERLYFSKTQVMDIVGRVWIYILIGVGIFVSHKKWVDRAIAQSFPKLIVNFSLPAQILLAFTQNFTRAQLLASGLHILLKGNKKFS